MNTKKNFLSFIYFWLRLTGFGLASPGKYICTQGVLKFLPDYLFNFYELIRKPLWDTLCSLQIFSLGQGLDSGLRLAGSGSWTKSLRERLTPDFGFKSPVFVNIPDIDPRNNRIRIPPELRLFVHPWINNIQKDFFFLFALSHDLLILRCVASQWVTLFLTQSLSLLLSG